MLTAGAGAGTIIFLVSATSSTFPSFLSSVVAGSSVLWSFSDEVFAAGGAGSEGPEDGFSAGVFVGDSTTT